MHNSVGLGLPVPAQTPPNSRRAGRHGNSVGATGVRVGVALPVDGLPETALNCEAFGPQRRKQLKGSRSEPPGCIRGSLRCCLTPACGTAQVLFAGGAR